MNRVNRKPVSVTSFTMDDPDFDINAIVNAVGFAQKCVGTDYVVTVKTNEADRLVEISLALQSGTDCDAVSELVAPIVRRIVENDYLQSMNGSR